MSLDKLRHQIDAVDRVIVASINRRAAIVKKVGALKRKSNAPVYVPARESQVFDRVTGHNRGPISDDAIRAIYREIMSGSIALEKPVTVAYLGPEASFSHAAAMHKFGASVSYVAMPDIPAVFTEVAKGHLDYGIVPIENSTEGGVNDTIDMFGSTDLKILAEIYLRIRHNLLARGSAREVKRIYSKLTVFGQCRHWLATNLPNAELVETVSTTRAAEIAAREKQSAAIASRMSAEKYALGVLYASIEDCANNVTRFFILSRAIQAKVKRSRYKTSLMVALRDKVGALHDMLVPFKNHHVNLTRIESRPSRRKAWEYFFFLDFEGFYKDRNPARCIRELQAATKEVRVLGSYPRAEVIH
ncbi:MAG: prephenate dehydratase [Planctomycetota bacterium]